jgi:uncharacterized 2Fe-2S/4Fe-4S cluster protein (DUF4445 family)
MTENRRDTDQAIVVFKPSGQVVKVPVGTLLSDAAVMAGVSLNLPCGGQGRCGRCRVRLEMGDISHRSGVRLSQSEREAGEALACQAVIKGDVVVIVPDQARIEQRVEREAVGAERIALAAEFTGELDPSVRRAYMEMEPPSLASGGWLPTCRRCALYPAGCAKRTGRSRRCWTSAIPRMIATRRRG